MKTAHTPAPWTFEKPDSNGVSEILHPVENGDWQYVTTMGTTDKNWEANARLIVASPLMLTALKAILTITARNGGTENDAEAIAAIEQLAAVAVRDAEGR